MSELFPLIASIYCAAEEIDPMAFAACPVCNSAKGHICWGHYWRYRPGTDQREAIQRLLCKNDQCPRQTFSVLPHPFLRIVRFTLKRQNSVGLKDKGISRSTWAPGFGQRR